MIPSRRNEFGAIRRSLPASAPPRLRAGYTLLEMLLVLAIITVISAMAWPSALTLFADHKVGESADEVRALLARGRAHAIENGIIYQFLHEPGGRQYMLIPYQTTSQEAEAQGDYFKETGELPEGLAFAESARGSEATGVAPHLLSGLAGADDLARTGWGAPILFYPDGSATDTTLVVADEMSRTVDVTVRELTGSVRISPVREGAGE